MNIKGLTNEEVVKLTKKNNYIKNSSSKSIAQIIASNVFTCCCKYDYWNFSIIKVKEDT